MKNITNLAIHISCILCTIIILVSAVYGTTPAIWYLYLMTFIAGILYPALGVCKILTREN